MTEQVISDAELSINMSAQHDNDNNGALQPSALQVDLPKAVNATDTKEVNNVNQSKKLLKSGNPPFVPPLISSKGQCNRCKSNTNITNETISCFGCNKLFHAVCCNKRHNLVPDAICTKTFLVAVRPVISKYGTNGSRWGNFRYTCYDCDLAFKQFLKFSAKSGKSINSLLDVLTSEIPGNTRNTSSEISDDPIENVSGDISSPQVIDLPLMISEMKSDILKSVGEMIDQKLSSPCPIPTTDDNKVNSPGNLGVIAPSSSSSSSTDICYASVASSDSSSNSNLGSLSSNSFPAPNIDKSTTEVLIVENPSEPPDLRTILSTLTDALSETPVIFVDDKKYQADKKLVIGFPNLVSKEKGKSILSQCSSMQRFGFMFSDRQKALPKITVANIPNDIFSDISQNLPREDYRTQCKAILKSHIIMKNIEIKNFIDDSHVFDVVFINVGDKYTTAGIRISPQIHSFLMGHGNQKLFIRNSSCLVSDRFLIKQCFKCQKIGHLSKDCHETTPVCMYCSGSHRTSSCELKSDNRSHRCRNCSVSKNPSIVSKCNTHHSGSKNCPIIMRSIERLQTNTQIIFSKN